jgi:hypothetical protein
MNRQLQNNLKAGQHHRTRSTGSLSLALPKLSRTSNRCSRNWKIVDQQISCLKPTTLLSTKTRLWKPNLNYRTKIYKICDHLNLNYQIHEELMSLKRSSHRLVIDVTLQKNRVKMALICRNNNRSKMMTSCKATTINLMERPVRPKAETKAVNSKLYWSTERKMRRIPMTHA